MNRRRFLSKSLVATAGLAAAPAIGARAAALVSQAPAKATSQAAGAKVSSPPQLVAHWGLDGDSKDRAGNHHGDARSVTFAEGVDGRAGGAAVFSAVDSAIEVPDADALNFGTQPFSLSLWLKLKEDLDSAPGDLISKFDAPLRRGFNLSLLGNSSGYSSYGDRKGLHFGIDNGINGSWLDHGRPWKTNPTITTLTVYKGELYAATGDASRAEDACRIFRFAGNEKWIDCGRVGNNPLTLSAFSTVVHKGKFYAGTGTWDWEKSNAGRGGRNHVYCYEGETRWSDCGAVGNGFDVMSLASFKGSLYAADDNTKCYRYDGDRSWSFCGQLDETNKLNCLMVYQGSLYGATHGFMYRYEGGTKWECIGRNPHGATQMHKLQVFAGRLCAGTWPHGKVLRYEGGSEWTDLGELGIPTDKFQINEVNDLQVYNGKLYAGVIPKAEVYRFESQSRWTLLRSLVGDIANSPLNTHGWARVTCMAEFGGRLFQGTSTCFGRYDPSNPSESGRVYSMEAGRNVSFDDDLGGAWRHVAAVREGDVVRLYLDGHLVSSSPAFSADDYNLFNAQPLMIGFGSNGSLSGTLDDIRLYRGALGTTQVLDLYKGRGK
jgi:concanavalin A-like lectin/glucanase superfamily protein